MDENWEDMSRWEKLAFLGRSGREVLGNLASSAASSAANFVTTFPERSSEWWDRNKYLGRESSAELSALGPDVMLLRSWGVRPTTAEEKIQRYSEGISPEDPRYWGEYMGFKRQLADSALDLATVGWLAATRGRGAALPTTMFGRQLPRAIAGRTVIPQYVTNPNRGRFVNSLRWLGYNYPALPVPTYPSGTPILPSEVSPLFQEARRTGDYSNLAQEGLFALGAVPGARLGARVGRSIFPETATRLRSLGGGVGGTAGVIGGGFGAGIGAYNALPESWKSAWERSEPPSWGGRW